MKYSNYQLTRFILQDLVINIKCAIRDGLPEYAEKCKRKFKQIWKTRTNSKLDRYGWPVNNQEEN